MSIMSLRRRRAVQGFNLIEAAIVLGIVGLVVGGIWVAATSVYANLRSKQATDNLLSIAQATRALYATSSTTTLANGTSMTATLAQAGAIPSNVLGTTPALTTDGNTVNPWGGNVAVFSTNNSTGTVSGGFQIQYTSVPSEACVDFMSRNTGTGRDVGMYHTVAVAAGAAGHTAIAGNAGNLLPGSAALQQGVLQLQPTITGFCDAAGGTPRNISFYFNLRG
jgi:type II secretory pathway pseudopilin PulG